MEDLSLQNFTQAFSPHNQKPVQQSKNYLTKQTSCHLLLFTLECILQLEYIFVLPTLAHKKRKKKKAHLSTYIENNSNCFFATQDYTVVATLFIQSTLAVPIYF